jgi:hypothetical protein
MSAPSGSNQGGYGASSNPYAQGSHPPGGNPYAQGSNPQGGNPYNPSGPGGYPTSGQQPYGGNPPSGQQNFGGNPYTQNTNTSGAGYPPSQSGGYPPQGGYPPSGGGYPPSGGGYPPSGGGYPPSGGSYPPSTGGYPGQQPPNTSQGGYGGPGPGASVGGLAPNDPRTQRLNQIIQQYEINAGFAARLQALGNCEIVVLCDDSGSMNTPIQGSNQTRWDELKSVCYQNFFSNNFFNVYL